MKDKEKSYTITCNREQLCIIAAAVEDWHRFLAGQCELNNATSYIEPTEAMHECRDLLDKKIRPYVVPELANRYGSSYNWSGSMCKNKYQRKAIAMSYMIYREILHYLTVERGIKNCLSSETLTCDEQGPMIKVETV